MTAPRIALLEVVEVQPRRGCIVQVDESKRALLPISSLPTATQLWPIVGDHVYVFLEGARRGELIAQLAGERELAPLTFIAPAEWHHTWRDGIVYNHIESGTFVIVEGGVLGFGVIGFIHKSEATRSLRIGERVSMRITYVRDDGRVNGSLRKQKEESRLEDAERILQHLQTCRDGAMPYSDETPPQLIRNKFGMSKAAFKRALGKLMKDGLIEQQGNWTRLKEQS